MNKGNENIFTYIESTNDINLIKRHALNCNILVQHYSLYNQIHVSRVFNYSLCSSTNKFTINKTETYTNDRSKKNHKHMDGKMTKCIYISDYNFYKWLGENKAIILTTNNEKINPNTLDPDILSLIKIIRKPRIRDKNLKNICNIYNNICSAPNKYNTLASTAELDKDNKDIINIQNCKAIAYLLLETEKNIKHFNLLQCEKNRVIRVNCQSSILVSENSSILSSIAKLKDITALDVFLQIIDAHM